MAQIEINKDIKIGDTGVALKDVLNYNDVYSTDEVKTDKIWIDGKPIYRIVLTKTTDGTPNDVSLRTPETMQTLIFLQAFAKTTEGGNIDVFPNNSISYATGNTPRGMTYITPTSGWNANAIYMVNTNGYNSFWAILEYTKN